MSKSILLFLILLYAQLSAQSERKLRVEYDDVIAVSFESFSENGEVLDHVSTFEDLDLKKPESMVQSYFYVSDSVWHRNTYSDEASFPGVKSPEAYLATKNKSSSNVIKMYHKMCFTTQGGDWCKFLVTMHYEDGSLIPLIISTQKLNGRWYFGEPINQQKLDLLLLNIKSCVWVDLLDGKQASNNELFERVQSNEVLDVYRLYEARTEFTENEEHLYTNNEGNTCLYEAKNEENKIVESSVNYNSPVTVGTVIELYESSWNSSAVDSLRSDMINTLAENYDLIDADPQAIYNFRINNEVHKLLKYKLSGKADREYYQWLSKEPVFDKESDEGSLKMFLTLAMNLEAKLLYKLTLGYGSGQPNFLKLVESTRGDSFRLNVEKTFRLYKSHPELFLMEDL